MPKSVQRTVEKTEWVGWNRIEELVERAEGLAKGLIIVGFKTGGRISEFVQLKSEVASFDADFWTVTLPLLKKYEMVSEVEKWKCKKCGRRWINKPNENNCREGGAHDLETYMGWNTKGKNKERRVEWPKDEPLNDVFREYVENKDGLLFPHKYAPDRPISRQWAYNMITAVDEDIWPHWLRAQRACQLSEEAEFSIPDLKDWFGWETDKYAQYYSSRRYKMRDKMLNPARRIR